MCFSSLLRLCLSRLLALVALRFLLSCTIIAVTGRLGAGKTYYITRFLLRELLKGRRCYSNYAIDGGPDLRARALYDIRDIGTQAFGPRRLTDEERAAKVKRTYGERRGAAFALDEFGMFAPARGTMSLDPLVFATVSQSRHLDCDMIYATPHAGHVDVLVRELTHIVIVLSRIGASGEELANIEPYEATWVQRHIPILSRPFRFIAEWFDASDFTVDMELRPGAVPLKTEKYQYKQRVADSYDTLAVVMPEDLQPRYKLLDETAHTRAAAPEWVLDPVSHRVSPVKLSAGWITHHGLPKLLPMVDRKGKGGDEIVDVVERLRQMGYELHPDDLAAIETPSPRVERREIVKLHRMKVEMD